MGDFLVGDAGALLQLDEALIVALALGLLGVLDLDLGLLDAQRRRGAGERGLRALDGLCLQKCVGFRDLQSGLGLADARVVSLRIEPGDDLALFDRVVEIDQHIGDTPGQLRADVDRDDRFDNAGGLDVLGDHAALDRHADVQLVRRIAANAVDDEKQRQRGGDEPKARPAEKRRLYPIARWIHVSTGVRLQANCRRAYSTLRQARNFDQGKLPWRLPQTEELLIPV